MVYVTEAILYKNYHSLVLTFYNISLLIKYLAKDTIFEQCFEKDIGIETLLWNIFGEDITNISRRVTLKECLNHVKDNWQNINIQANSTGNDNVNDTVKKRGCSNELNIEN